MIGTKIYKESFDEEMYLQCAMYCNEHNTEAQIEDKGAYYEVTEIPEPTEEEKQNMQYQLEAEQAEADMRRMESQMMRTLLTGGNVKTVQSAYQTSLMSLSDGAALKMADYFPEWDANSRSYAVGDRIVYNGTLYKVITAHTSQSTWTPTEAPSLFAEVLVTGTEETPPEWKQPDSTNPYMIGDRVTYNGKTYESTVDNNVWSPADYPQGWKEIN